jgi:hypothetical protein
MMMSKTTMRWGALAVLAGVAATAAVAGHGGARAQTAARSRVRFSFPPVGLVPGQSIRVSVASLLPPPIGDTPPPIGDQPPPIGELPPPIGELPPPVGDTPPPTGDRVRLFLLDERGRRIADSGPRAIGPGRMEVVTVDRGRLPGGEPSGRLQVRAVVVMSSQSALPIDPCRPSVEILDGFGRTVVLIPPPVGDLPPPVNDTPAPGAGG